MIGVAFRAKLAFQGPRSPESLAAARVAKRAAPKSEDALRRDRERKAAKAAAKAARPAPAPKPRPEPAQPAGIPTSLRIPLVEAREGECRFIADDPRAGPATCCGHVAVEGSPYCPAHTALCTVPVRRAVSLWMPGNRRAA